MQKLKIITVSLLFSSLTGWSQIVTSQDSITDGISAKSGSTIFSGYGDAKVVYDGRLNSANANLTSNVFYVYHKFTDNISLFSGVELDNAGIQANHTTGSIAVQQCFLKFNLNANNYLVAGLFTPRIGIINENELPTTYNGNDRPFVESLIIPTVWREVGIGLYGKLSSTPLYYSLGLVNGLNSAGFSMTQGIGGQGLYQGQNASALSLAVTGSLLYYAGQLRIQASGYFGGSAQLTQKQADSLQLTYGPFGTPVALGELDVQYIGKAVTVKALGTIVSIPDADSLNRAYATNVPQEMIGGYLEVATNLLYLLNNNSQKNLTLFGRYEYVDLDAMTPANGISNGAEHQKYIVAGLTYKPIKNITIKADYVLRLTGSYNPGLLVPFSGETVNYYTANAFFNLGLAYSFN